MSEPGDDRKKVSTGRMRHLHRRRRDRAVHRRQRRARDHREGLAGGQFPAYPGGVDNFWVNAAWSITPTILVGLIFWLVLRTILHADRTERKVYAQIEAEERAKLGLPSPDPCSRDATCGESTRRQLAPTGISRSAAGAQPHVRKGRRRQRAARRSRAPYRSGRLLRRRRRHPPATARGSRRPPRGCAR